MAWELEIELLEGIVEWRMAESCSSWLQFLVNWDLNFAQQWEVVGMNILQSESGYALAGDEVDTVKASVAASFAS